MSSTARMDIARRRAANKSLREFAGHNGQHEDGQHEPFQSTRRHNSQQLQGAPSLCRTTNHSQSLLSNKSSSSFATSSVGADEEYANKRQMTLLQEKVNAITILPSALQCVHYMLSQKWFRDETLQKAKETLMSNKDALQDDILLSLECMSVFSYRLPPPTILAICIGVILHCPCSFLYHWKYAPAISIPSEKFKHWSRRLDHCAIHVCSALWSYSLSGGSIAYFGLNVVYNAHCIKCHLQKEIVPRRNQMRILLSMLLYTAPLLFMHSKLQIFLKVWSIFGVAVWFFAAYPVGGWSHAAFHLVMMAVPPLLLDMVADMEADGEWAMTAAQCRVLKEAGL